ncbi:MAG: nitroreductase [Anaerolineae bacterium]
MDVWDAIRAKRAVRRFTDAPLPDAVARRILDAGRRAQSAKNSQPWDFVVVRDRERLRALAQCGAWLGHVAGAALCVAIVTPSPAGNDRYAWNLFDAGQCAAYMQLAAHEMGVGSCLGTVYEAERARALLGYPEDRELRIVISFGYPDPDTQQGGLGRAGRRPFDEVVHWERW